MKFQIRIGAHEFSAECNDNGENAYALDRLRDFREMVFEFESKPTPGEETLEDLLAVANETAPLDYDVFFGLGDSWVVINEAYRFSKEPDEILQLLLLGFLKVTNQMFVSATDLRLASEEYGLPVSRIDRALANAISSRNVRTTGAKKGMRYGLTVSGVKQARSLMLLAMM